MAKKVSINKNQTPAHLCRSLQEVKVLTSTNINSPAVRTIPPGSIAMGDSGIESPLEISAEVWVDGVQYGYLTSKCCKYYGIQEQNVCVAIQSEDAMFCVHALTYIYRKQTNRERLGVE